MVYSKEHKQLGTFRNQNLFCWATKELSQDAIIAWVLCGENGKAFLKSLTSHKLTDNEKALPEEFEIEAVYAQDSAAPSSKIDIFVEIAADGKKYAIIIEDKTDSWIHDQQLLKYTHSVCQEKKQKRSRDAKYAGIFVVVVKTGSYYFWEHEQLIAEASTIRERIKPPRWVFTNWSDDIQQKIKEINEKKIDISFFYYLYEDYYDFIKGCDITSAWMKDYIDYLRAAKPEQSWMTDRKHSVNDLKSRLYPDAKYPFYIRRPSGGGKKAYSVEISIYGDQVGNKLASIEKRLCLLVFVELQAQGKIKIGLNCHLFFDENQPAGYCPSKKLEAELKQEERDKYQEYRKRLQQYVWSSLDEKRLVSKNRKEIKSLGNLQVCTFECSNSNCFESDVIGNCVQELVSIAEKALQEVCLAATMPSPQ